MSIPAPFLSQSTATATGNIYRPLPTLKDFKHWNEPRNGFCALVTSGVLLEASVLTCMYPQLLSGDPLLQAVATHLVTNAQLQWMALLAWMTTFFYRLEDDGHLSKSEAWDVVAQSARALFDELCTVRAAAQDATSMTEDDDISSANVIWAVMQTHRLLDKMHAQAWDGHHSIQAVLAMHVLRNGACQPEIACLKASVATLIQMVDRLDSKVSRLPGGGGATTGGGQRSGGVAGH